MEDLNILTPEEINKSLGQIPGWKYADDKISKEFVFPDFQNIVSFVQKLTPHFQKIDHHPDIHIYYTRAVFELQRFSVGQVTPRDIEVAKYIDREYGEIGK